MIINIRGSSGSGKSTVVRKLMARYGATPIFGLLGMKRPEAYRFVDLPPTYVIGPYVSNCGGCDAVGKMDRVTELITKYQAKGNVIFEGLLISSMYGSIGLYLEKQKHVLVAFLTTSEQRCREQLGIRQASSGRAKGDKTFYRHFDGTQSVKVRMLKDNIVRVEDLDPDKAVEQITKWLAAPLSIS